MNANRFKNMPDKDLDVIIKAQEHHPKYLEAVREYTKRQQVKEKKHKKLSYFMLVLNGFIAILTLLLAYFAIGVGFYGLPIPFG